MPPYPILDRAGCWYLHSGIQEPAGGVARYYRSDAEANARVSTEITGYAVSTMLYLHSLTGHEEYLKSARAAAAFLTRTAWNDELAAMPFEDSASSSLTYFFDCGIIVRGLLALYRATGESEWLEVAELCGDSMWRDFRSADGRYHPILMLPSKEPLLGDERWSRNPGCYQLKSAVGWLELARATGRDAWIEPYEQVLAYSIEEHCGFSTVEPQRERIMDRLHAYCYFLEGLLPRVDRPECREALINGIGRTEALQREVAPFFARSDVYAQLLRLRIYADVLGVLPLDSKAAEEEARCLTQFQLDGVDGRRRGSFCFGRKGETLLPFANPVSTAFGVQALTLWSEYQEGHRSADPRILI